MSLRESNSSAGGTRAAKYAVVLASGPAAGAKGKQETSVTWQYRLRHSAPHLGDESRHAWNVRLPVQERQFCDAYRSSRPLPAMASSAGVCRKAPILTFDGTLISGMSLGTFGLKAATSGAEHGELCRQTNAFSDLPRVISPRRRQCVFLLAAASICLVGIIRLPDFSFMTLNGATTKARKLKQR